MNIIQIAYFVLNFMKKYNDNYVRYFIILDSIPYDLLKELNEYEREARKDKNCYIIELFQNKNMEDILYRNVIESNIKDDELSLYQNNYSDLKLVQDLDKKDLDFLLNNFGESLFYYQKFKKWKKNNNNNNYNEFLLITMNEIENDLLKEFKNKNEGKSFYRYILLKNEFNDIIDKKILKNLNLDYFFIEKKEESLNLIVSPLIKNVLRRFENIPIQSLLFTNFFKISDEFIKGVILEDIAKEEIKSIFKNNAYSINDYQEININRLLDNEIFTFYSDKTIKTILNKNKNYQDIKKNYIRKNLKLKKKVTIFNQLQNAKHYDIGVLYYNKLFLFQATINRKESEINEIINQYVIDLHFIIKKIEDLSGKNF